MQIKNVLFFFISSRLSKGLANCLDRHFWSGIDAESVSVNYIRNVIKKLKIFSSNSGQVPSKSIF